MASKRDYYEVLGVNKSDDADTIKKAYRKLAIKYHPDRNKEEGAEDRFKEISEAYAVLSDQEKRSKYDQFGHAGIDGQYSREDIFRGADFGDIFGGMGGFGDIFDTLFGGGRRRQQRGRDLQATVQITLREAFEGHSEEVTFPQQTTCSRCKGEGAEPGTKVSTCGTCGGRGQVMQQVRTPFGVMQNVGACPTCRGQGKQIETHCRTCAGSGHEQRRRSITVDIPKGIEDGQSLRVSGEGDQMPGLPSGDLYVEVRVKPDPRFHREGSNLLTQLPIHYHLATLGGSMELDTMDGTVDIEIPAGTQSGKTLRIRGKGMPVLGGTTRGDLHVRIQVVTPTKISTKAKKLLEDLAEELGDEVPEGHKKGFFDFLRGN